ncbi:MAG: hypothetical protein Q8P50_07480 [Bacillota bacterium]|nr:hypothetical protein [Bacillota bacterium]
MTRSSENEQGPEPEMHDEYDFSGGVRAKYAARFAEASNVNVIVLDPDVAEVFRDPKAVNDALRLLARAARESQRAMSPYRAL